MGLTSSLPSKSFYINYLDSNYGGEGGIRTHGTHEGSTVFETARFNPLSHLTTLHLPSITTRPRCRSAHDGVPVRA